MISAAEHPKRFTQIDGIRIAHVERGPAPGAVPGRTVIFLHGNPTSSYLWRNVLPHMPVDCRCLAPDLAGMGDSGKLPGAGGGRYSFATHARFLERWIAAAAGEGPVTLVIHDWGSALGFDWARRNAGRVAGLCSMEGIVAIPTWDDWPKRATPVFQALRGPQGETMILEQNAFIEQVLPASVIRPLTVQEMAVYRRPFEAPEDRWPTLDWPRSIPFDGDPADVAAVVEAYGAWMAANEIPKLFINAEPGAILRGRVREICRAWKNQTEVTVPGIHFIQEDSPHEIGRAIAAWLPPAATAGT